PIIATAPATSDAQVPRVPSAGEDRPPTRPPAGGEKSQGAGRGRSMSPDERAGLLAQLDQLEIRTLGALNNRGPATENVLRDTSVPRGAVDAAAKSSGGGAARGVGGLNLGRGGGDVIVPWPGGQGLQTLGSTRAATRGAGEGVIVKAPLGNET